MRNQSNHIIFIIIKSKEDHFSYTLSTLFFILPCMQNLYFMEYKSNWSLEQGEILQTTTQRRRAWSMGKILYFFSCQFPHSLKTEVKYIWKNLHLYLVKKICFGFTVSWFKFDYVLAILSHLKNKWLLTQNRKP